MRYLILLLFINSAFSMECSPNQIKEEMLNERNLVYSELRKVFKEINCGRYDECIRRREMYHEEFSSIIKFRPNGRHLIKKYLEFYTLEKVEDYPRAFDNYLTHCIKKPVSCSDHQVREVTKLADEYKNMKGAKGYLARLISYIREKKFKELKHAKGSFTKRKMSGEVLGEPEKVTYKDGTYFIDGEKAPEHMIGYAKSMIREKEAAKHLSSFGVKVQFVPTKRSERMEQGIHRDFERIRRFENLSQQKSPDLIVNNDYIVDIYSPSMEFSLENIDLMTSRILTKTEAPRRSFKAIKESHKGKRQTNRVLIYTKRPAQNMGFFIEKLRESLISKNPNWLDELTILSKNKDGNTELLQVWPY